MTPEQAWQFIKSELLESRIPTDVLAFVELASAQKRTGGYDIAIAVPRKQRRHLEALQTLIAQGFCDSLPTLECSVTFQPVGDDWPSNDLHAVWESVLSSLQAEMPRASFDTWVRDTQAVAFTEGQLTISVRNAYARDWLKERLAQIITRLASDILAEPVVNLKIVVASEIASDNEIDNDRIDESTDKKGTLTIEPADATAYQDAVHPDKIVLIPGYALRLMEQGDLTAKEMSLWVGFRQAVYIRWKKKQGTAKNIPYWEAANFAMMSRASYFRELKNRITQSGKEYLAGGMVEIIQGTLEDLTNDARYDNANRYRVQMSPRLTHHDCAVIESILTAEVCQAGTYAEGVQFALRALEDLAARSPSEYLELPSEVDKTWPRNIHEIVRRVLGLEGDLPEDLHAAAEKVYDRIVGAYGNVLITHYFLRVVAPTLGLTHPQAWAIIMLRDRCWYDYETGEQHNFAVVPGGLNTVAAWVGITRKALDGWLVDPVFSAFVRQVDMLSLNIAEAWASNTAIFLVSQQEPMLANHDELEKVRLGIGKSETRYWKKRDSGSEKVRLALEKMRLALGKSETLLNSLIKPLLNPNKPLLTLPTTVRENRAHRAGVGNMAFWEFDFLMANNAVSQGGAKSLLKTQKELGREIAKLSQSFVSWLLYGYSRAGQGLSNPVNNAIARMRENIYAGAGGDFDRLAALRPAQLKAFFDADLAGKLDPDESFEANIYAYQFGELADDHKRELQRRLFG